MVAIACEGPSAAGAAAPAVACLDAALELWASAGEPQGYVQCQAAITALLPVIACAVPGSTESAQTADILIELFLPSRGEDACPLFLKMVKARAGEVHFLYFWRAFSQAGRLLAGVQRRRGAAAEPGQHLAEELETLRDALLRGLEARATSQESSFQQLAVPVAEVLQAVEAAASMSSAPEFWRAAERSLEARRRTESTGEKDAPCHSWPCGRCCPAPNQLGSLSLDELTVVLLAWLREAAAWQAPAALQAAALPAPAAPKLQAAAAAVPEAAAARKRTPVLLHIYDVSQEDSIRKLNKVLAHKRSPLKFGGIFHAGVEVNGLEWSFGLSTNECIPGISCTVPRKHPQHHYRQTVCLQGTKMTAEEVAELLSQLIEEYPGDDYDLLRRNCCHFADDFVRRLGAGHIPGWVHRLARVGALVDGALQRAVGCSLIPEDDD